MSIKIVLIGDSNIGKTCFARSVVPNDGTELVVGKPTIGAAFVSKTYLIGRTVAQVHLWDTAGQERFRSMMPLYFRDAEAAIVMFDSTDEFTYNNTNEWRKLFMTERGDAICVLVANKCDVGDRCFYAGESTEIASISRSRMFAEFYEVSARTGMGVDQMMRSVAAKVLSERKEHTENTKKRRSSVVQLERPARGAHRKKCAC